MKTIEQEEAEKAQNLEHYCEMADNGLDVLDSRFVDNPNTDWEEEC